jgi:hypothetical protein
MSDVVTGSNLPEDLMAVLRKYGLPERPLRFKVECTGPNAPLILNFTAYARMPHNGEAFGEAKETRTFKLVEVV